MSEAFNKKEVLGRSFCDKPVDTRLKFDTKLTRETGIQTSETHKDERLIHFAKL